MGKNPVCAYTNLDKSQEYMHFLINSLVFVGERTEKPVPLHRQKGNKGVASERQTKIPKVKRFKI